MCSLFRSFCVHKEAPLLNFECKLELVVLDSCKSRSIARCFLLNSISTSRDPTLSLIPYRLKDLSSLAAEDEISRRKEETSELESVVRDRTAQMATLVGDLELLQVRGYKTLSG